MADLRVNIAGLTFRNPVIAAAGPNTETGAACAAAAAGGAGGVVARTVTLAPRHQPEPQVAPFGREGLFNRQAGSPVPFDQWVREEYPAALSAARAQGVPLIASIGFIPAEVGAMAPRLQALGVDGLEYSAHHTERKDIAAALAAIRAASTLPLFVKLSPHHGEDMGALAAELEPLVDGFVCINAFGPTLLFDAETASPLVGGEGGIGYISGAPIRPIAQRFVFEVARAVQKPVIACGGAAAGRDVIEFLMVGAAAVQVCTQAVLKGPSIYGRMAAEAGAWLDEHAHAGLAPVQAEYVRRYGHGQLVITEKQESPQLIADACIKCTICGTVCFYDAIVAPPKVLPEISHDPCFQCGLCVSACPTNALVFEPREDVTRIRLG